MERRGLEMLMSLCGWSKGFASAFVGKLDFLNPVLIRRSPKIKCMFWPLSCQKLLKAVSSLLYL